MFTFKLLAIIAFIAVVESARPIPQSKSISLAELESYIQELDSTNGFKELFDSLGDPTTQLKTWNYASLPANIPKHRYPPPNDSLLTYDETRVQLTKLPNDQHSDFINANWIDNYARDYSYIATQCPIDSTIDDFYRMVWEKNVHEVVALASPHDIEKGKCSRYFPEKDAKYGGLEINLERKEEYPDIVVRIYSLKKDDLVRVFVHHHFVSWPDLGVPEDPQQLLNLILKYRSSDTYTQAWPLAVHCSAGVGRTGTFLLTDAMFESALETGRVDFFTHLKLMREQRISVVEKPEQYRLAHLVVLEAYKQGLFDKNNKNVNLRDHIVDVNNNKNTANNRGGHVIRTDKGPGWTDHSAYNKQPGFGGMVAPRPVPCAA